MKYVHGFLILFEAIQVIASILDIWLDIIVCFDFYEKKQWIPFYSSVLVFIIAQMAYAFVFSATYARKITTPKGKIKAFLFALPLAQLVPLFNWLESFHFSKVDQFLRYLDLAPTSQSFEEEEEEVVSSTEKGISRQDLYSKLVDILNTCYKYLFNKKTESMKAKEQNPLKRGFPEQTSEEDDFALWSFAHKKFKSNFGFLVEAIVEAIPQAMIQTCAVVVYGDADLLIVLSILMSIFVVSSKGYMLSYSIHLQTFAFNACCIVADICGLFATIVWAFGTCSIDSLFGSSDPDPSFKRWFDWSLISIVITGFGGLTLSQFANCDDHIKIRLKNTGRLIISMTLPTNSPWFDLWVVRTITWSLAVLPASVMLLSLKITSLPLFYFHSVEPAHYSFPKVHQRMFRYLSNGGPSKVTGRLFELNKIIRLLTFSMEPSKRHLFLRAAEKQAIVPLYAFISNLGAPIHYTTLKPATTTTNAPTEPSLIAEFISPDADRKQVRWENRKNRAKRTFHEFERRSVIVWFILGAYYDGTMPGLVSIDPGVTNRFLFWRSLDFQEKQLLILGIFTLFLSIIAGLLLIPSMLILGINGFIIPFLGPYRLGLRNNHLSFETILGLVLSGIYLFCLILILILLPSVSRFHSIAKDIITLSDSDLYDLGEDAFYKVGLDICLEQAYLRYRIRLGKELLIDFLETKTNPDASKRILSYLETSEGLPKEGF